MLEEELLFPANTQVAVFVSMDVGDFFALDSVTLKIDNHEVSNYLYTPREVAALLKGGVQRLYVGNLKAGAHELVALFTGKGPQRARLPPRRDSSSSKRAWAPSTGAQDHRPRSARSSPNSKSRTGNSAQRVAPLEALFAAGCCGGVLRDVRRGRPQPDPPTSCRSIHVQDLHYGDVLFHFYPDETSRR